MDEKEDSAWMGELRWRGYPKLVPVPDVASRPEPAPGAPRGRKGADLRAETLARENEELRAKIVALTALGAEFERRLSDAVQAYEGAALDADSARRSFELDNARLTGELGSVRGELTRREARDLARESELALERERRMDADKALLELRRAMSDAQSELVKSRGKSAELAGSIGELRRQADASHDRLVRAKALTDNDVAILRQEMRDFLAKFHRIQESFGDKE